MVDTILSPSGVEGFTVRTIIVPGLGTVAPVGSLTPAQVQELRDDVQAVLNLELNDLSNVTEAGKAEGFVLTVQPDGNWAPEDRPGMLSEVNQNWAPVMAVPNVTRLSFTRGLAVTQHSTASDTAVISPVFGSSGSSDAAARADHIHPPNRIGRFSFDKGASVLGGGTSPLVDESVGSLVPTAIYDISVTGALEAVNTNASGRVRLYVKIGDATETFTTRGFSGGVWTEITSRGTRMSVTGLSSIRLQLWVEYLIGDPVAMYTGELVYSMTPRGGTT